jgi:hypothetical protein
MEVVTPESSMDQVGFALATVRQRKRWANMGGSERTKN